MKAGVKSAAPSLTEAFWNKLKDCYSQTEASCHWATEAISSAFGFEYNEATDTFYTNQASMQSFFGFANLYDEVGPALGMDIASNVVYFSANDKQYRLETWKGSYGYGNMYGGEIGLYVKDSESPTGWARVESAIPGLYPSAQKGDQIRTFQKLSSTSDPSTSLIRNDTADYAGGGAFWNLATKTQVNNPNPYNKSNLIQTGTLYVTDDKIRNAMYAALVGKLGGASVSSDGSAITYKW